MTPTENEIATWLWEYLDKEFSFLNGQPNDAEGAAKSIDAIASAIKEAVEAERKACTDELLVLAETTGDASYGLAADFIQIRM